MSQDNIIFIGRKPAMTYVMAVMATFNNQNVDHVILKARGQAITTAVDTAEITRNRYITDLTKPTIEISTEQVQGMEGEPRNVSSISITLTKGTSKTENEEEDTEKTESDEVENK
jgi:DNA-binding protein